jgi:diguanylate cyclase (GGDEF)-like protein
MSPALECYLYSITEIAEIFHAISPEAAASLSQALLTLHFRLSADPSSEALEQSRGELHDLLQIFCRKARLNNETLARDLQQTLSMVVQSQDSSSGKSREDFTRLRRKIAEIQHRLHEVELLATLDPLTGVANRRDLDRELAARIDARQEFCVLLFDVDGFKVINDRYGHLYGDQVLKQLAARLSGQVRSRDYVCRWGGDEFLAILACDLTVAESRARQIAERLKGPYHIVVAGCEIQLDTAVTVGLVQHCAGESPEQIFRRVDEAMYRQKRAALDGSPPEGRGLY